MAVLAQTRLAAVRYTLVADEFLVWDEAVRDDDLIVRHLASSESAGVDNELELIRARARALASRINRDLSYANLQASVARLYNSVGYDAVPQGEQAKAVDELTQLIEARFDELEHASFSKRAAMAKPTVAAGLVSGGQPRIVKLVQQGLGKALETAGFASSESADVRLDMRLSLDPAKDGVRTVRVAVSALPRGTLDADADAGIQDHAERAGRRRAVARARRRRGLQGRHRPLDAADHAAVAARGDQAEPAVGPEEGAGRQAGQGRAGRRRRVRCPCAWTGRSTRPRCAPEPANEAPCLSCSRPAPWLALLRRAGTEADTPWPRRSQPRPSQKRRSPRRRSRSRKPSPSPRRPAARSRR